MNSVRCWLLYVSVVAVCVSSSCMCQCLLYVSVVAVIIILCIIIFLLHITALMSFIDMPKFVVYE